MKDSTALIIVDVQNDFITGSLATDPDNVLAPKIADFVKAMEAYYTKIVTTQDWHIDPDNHWVREGEEPNFSTTWPVHCAADTEGSELETTLKSTLESLSNPVEYFYKGQYTAAYSGFESRNKKGQLLGTYLRNNLIREVDVIGIATDFCVKETVQDAADEGFVTNVLSNLTRGVSTDESSRLLTNDFDRDTVTVMNLRGGDK